MCLAVPGEIVRIEGEDPVYRVGQVSFAGVIKEVSLAYVPEARVGDYALVHAGFAISLLDPEQAEQVWGYLKEMRDAGDIPGRDDALPG